MRVLIVVDNLADSAAQEVLVKLRDLFDAKRIQLVACALRTPPEAFALQVDVALHQKRFGLQAVQQLVHLIRDYQVEVIHILEASALAAACMAGRQTGIPVLLSRFDVDWVAERSIIAQFIRRTGWRFVQPFVDRIILPAEVIQRDLRFVMARSEVPAEIVYPGYNVPDPASLPDRAALGLPDGPLIATFPTVAGDEGYEIMFDVLHRVLKRVPGTTMVVAGEGPAVADLRRRAANIRPALPVRWLGNANPWAVLAACNVLVEYQTRDRIPPSLFMAALLGRPSIAIRLPSMSEVIETSVTGILVTLGDASDMASQIARVLLHEGVARRLGTTSQRRAEERFSLMAYRKAMTELYEARVYSTR